MHIDTLFPGIFDLICLRLTVAAATGCFDDEHIARSEFNLCCAPKLHNSAIAVFYPISARFARLTACEPKWCYAA